MVRFRLAMNPFSMAANSGRFDEPGNTFTVRFAGVIGGGEAQAANKAAAAAAPSRLRRENFR